MKNQEARARAIVDALAGPLIEELGKLSDRLAKVEARYARNDDDDLARTLGIERVAEPDLDNAIYPEIS